ncbi:MAG: HupE/UreJ family protein [Acidobacteriota bacterium]
MSPLRYRRVAVGLVGLALVLALPAHAHDLERTHVTLTFAADGSFVLDIANDPAWLLLRLESFAGGQVPRGLTADARDARLRDLGAVFIDRVVLFVDGREIRPVSAEYLPPRPSSGGDLRPALAVYRLRGRMPADARTLRWLYGLVIDPYPLTVQRADGASVTEWIDGWNWSGVIDLSGQFRHTRRDVMRDYLTLGYTHILPKGLDHVLFVLGLFFLSVRLRPILIQVTTFTVAHSITLGLTVYGIVSLPPSVVEPLIALSIAYVAIENLVTSQLRPWRLALVFAFGLLHGMGFAGVLANLGLPRGEFLTALLSFNLGVEAGQLTVISAVALCVAWYRHRAWYHRVVVVPASLAIAATGLYWTVARVIR